MNANYSSSDPFENGRLFCVSKDIEILDAEVYFQMDGDSAHIKMKNQLGICTPQADKAQIDKSELKGEY